MHSYYSTLFPLLTLPFLHAGTPVQSNSPHSPYTQLRVLSEKITSVEASLEKMKANESLPDILRDENKQLTASVELLKIENKNLQDQLEKQREELLTLSKEFQQYRSQENEANSRGIEKQDLASVKKDISQIKETLSTTQNEIGDLDRRLAHDGSKSSQGFQEQLQKIKSELTDFCQSTNQKLQDFSEQIRNNLTKMARNECIKHTIVSGESLASIARRYHTTPDKILSANHLQDTRGLHVGDTLLVPQEAF